LEDADFRASRGAWTAARGGARPTPALDRGRVRRRDCSLVRARRANGMARLPVRNRGSGPDRFCIAGPVRTRMQTLRSRTGVCPGFARRAGSSSTARRFPGPGVSPSISGN